MSVISLVVGNIGDVPGQMEAAAGEIREGKFGEVRDAVAVFIDVEGKITVCGWSSGFGRGMALSIQGSSKNMIRALALAALALLALAGSSQAQVCQVPWHFVNGPGNFIDANQVNANFAALEKCLVPATTTSLGLVQPDGITITVNGQGVISSAAGGSDSVLTLLDLENTSTVAFPNGVWRISYLGAPSAPTSPPLFYLPTTSPCALNGGAGDGGSQVSSKDGLCWLAQFQDGGDVRQWGALCNGTGDDYPPIQAAVNYESTLGGIVLLPTGVCRMSSGTPTVPAATNVSFRGASLSATEGDTGSALGGSELLQMSATGGCLWWLNDPTTLLAIGDARDVVCLAGTNRNTVNSSGAGIVYQGGGNDAHFQNIVIDGFSTTLQTDWVWNDTFENFWIFNTNIAWLRDCDPTRKQGGGLRILNWEVANAAGNLTGIGTKWCGSGGDYVNNLELDGWYHNALFQTAATKEISGVVLDALNSDSAISDGIVLDGTNGFIQMHGRILSNFNNGSGIKFVGIGSNLEGNSFTGGEMRENGLYAIDSAVGEGNSFNSLHIAADARGMVTINTPGSGCSVNDFLTLPGGSGGWFDQIIVANVNGSGGVTNARQWSSQYGTPPSFPVATTGGTCSVQPTITVTYPTNSAAVHVGDVFIFSFNDNTIGNFASNSHSLASAMIIDGDNQFNGSQIRSKNNNTVSLPTGAIPWINNNASDSLDWTNYPDVILTGLTQSYIPGSGIFTSGNVPVTATPYYVGKSSVARLLPSENDWATFSGAVSCVVGRFYIKWPSYSSGTETYTATLYEDGSSTGQSMTAAESAFAAKWYGNFVAGPYGHAWSIGITGSGSADPNQFSSEIDLRCQ